MRIVCQTEGSSDYLPGSFLGPTLNIWIQSNRFVTQVLETGLHVRTQTHPPTHPHLQPPPHPLTSAITSAYKTIYCLREPVSSYMKPLPCSLQLHKTAARWESPHRSETCHKPAGGGGLPLESFMEVRRRKWAVRKPNTSFSVVCVFVLFHVLNIWSSDPPSERGFWCTERVLFDLGANGTCSRSGTKRQKFHLSAVFSQTQKPQNLGKRDENYGWNITEYKKKNDTWLKPE